MQSVQVISPQHYSRQTTPPHPTTIADILHFVNNLVQETTDQSVFLSVVCTYKTLIEDITD